MGLETGSGLAPGGYVLRTREPGVAQSEDRPARYLWDLGARSAFEGQRLVLIATVGHLNLKALAAAAAAAQQAAPAE